MRFSSLMPGFLFTWEGGLFMKEIHPDPETGEYRSLVLIGHIEILNRTQDAVTVRKLSTPGDRIVINSPTEVTYINIPDTIG